MTFEETFAAMVGNGAIRDAIKFASAQASHALAAAAGLHVLHYSDLEEAIRLSKLAIEAEPGNPKLYANLACLLTKEDRLQESISCCEKGLLLKNPPADLYYNYGTALMSLGRYQESAIAYRKARDLNPSDPITHTQLANVLLAIGEFSEGLIEDEWRFKAYSGLRRIRNRYTAPDWDGKQDLSNVRLLVFNDQGNGDALQFARYLKILKEKGAYIILEVQNNIAPLFFNADYVDQVVPREEFKSSTEIPVATGLPHYDMVVSVVSLPALINPQLDKIPLETPYLTTLGHGGEEAIAKINVEKFNVGLVWAGYQWHTNDRDRSCFLRMFEKISQLSKVQLYSLQHGNMIRTWPTGLSVVWEGDENIQVVDLLEGSEKVSLVDLSPYITNFSDTGNILKKLDLLLTVDTSAAHLAGGLGVPVWLMLPWAHEWRWLKTWYPTMKVFKQSKKGDWAGMLQGIEQELNKICNNHSKFRMNNDLEVCRLLA